MKRIFLFIGLICFCSIGLAAPPGPPGKEKIPLPDLTVTEANAVVNWDPDVT